MTVQVRDGPERVLQVYRLLLTTPRGQESGQPSDRTAR